MLEHRYLPQRSHLLSRFNYYVNVAFPNLSVFLPACLPACSPLVPGSSSSSAVVLYRRCRPMSLITLYVIIAHQLLRRPYSLHPAPRKEFHSISFSHIAAGLKRTGRDTFCSLIISSKLHILMALLNYFTMDLILYIHTIINCSNDAQETQFYRYRFECFPVMYIGDTFQFGCCFSIA